MSGLACARELQSRQYHVLVVEARHRVGGRLKGADLQVGKQQHEAAEEQQQQQQQSRKNNEKSAKKGNSGKTKAKAPAVATAKQQQHSTTTTTTLTEKYHPVDLGGSLIHGIDDNPLYKLTQDLGVPTRSVQDCLLMDDSGWPVDARLDEKVSSIFNECLEESFQRVSSASAMKTSHPSSSNNTNGAENGNNNNNNKASWRLNTPRSTRSTVLSPETSSFDDLFQQVAQEKSIADTALLRWHKANLEVSCGAGFDRLGWAWNEDEPFGYDGRHNAVVPSWKAVVESLAEPLDVWHGAIVKRIRIVHPPPELLEEMEREREQQQLQQPKKKAKTTITTTTKIAVTKPRNPIEAPIELLPTRQSRRIRGEDVNVRRSGRANKGTVATRFTVDHDAPQQLPSSSSSRRRKRTHGGSSSSSSNRKQRPYSYVQVTVELYNPTGGASKTLVLEADAVVCTLPLGILKLSLLDEPEESGGVIFDPPLPIEKQNAIRKLGSGLLNKCALSFPHIFWQDSDFLGLADEGHSYLVLNVAAYTGQPILMFMFGGNYSKEIEDWSDTDIVSDCLNVIKKICGRQPPAPLDYQVTRWGYEQFSRMAFTYIPPGVDGFSELQTMSQPIYDHEGRVPVLMFAGEHTTPYHPSTIHGAFLSGIREAYRLDCALEPEDLGHLEFSEDELYQRTFLVEQKFEGSATRPEVDAAQEGTERKNPANQKHRQHRRRGAAGIMNFRNDSEHGESPPSGVLTAETTENSSAPRRSQRSAAGQFASPSHVRAIGNEVVEQESLSAEDLTALEDRTLLRSVESYGTNFAFIQDTILPVHGKDSTKSLVQIQSRCHKLLRSGKAIKPNRIRNAWKSWISDTLVPPTNASASGKRLNGRKSRKGRGK